MTYLQLVTFDSFLCLQTGFLMQKSHSYNLFIFFSTNNKVYKIMRMRFCLALLNGEIKF